MSIRFRAVFVGMLLGLVICVLTPYNNAYLNATPLAGGHFPLAPFFIFVWLAVIVAAVSKIFKAKPILTGIELFITAIFMFLVSGIGWTGLVRTFFINVTAPYHFAGAGNKFKEIIQPLLPESWYPQNKEAVALIYEGLEDGRDMGPVEVLGSIPWDAWLTPLITWGAFILLCWFTSLCMVNLFSRQWILNERVNFPLLRVPQFMTEALDEGRLFGFLANPWLITGLILTVLLHTLNGLNFYIPSVPSLSTLILAGSYFPQQGLLAGFSKLKIYIYPAFIGFAFLASRQISFSFWFFFLLGGLMYGLLGMIGLRIPDAALGVTFGPTMSRPDEAQMIGAYLVFFFFLVWLARGHLIDTARGAVGLAPLEKHDESARYGVEWTKASLSLWGLLLGFIALVAWCFWFGMPIIPAIMLMAVFFMVMLVASRIVCQGGIPYFTLTAAPTDGLLSMFGSGFFSSVGLVLAAVMQKVLFVDVRESLMPSLFHTAKAGEGVRQRRMLFFAVMAALVLALIAAFVSMLFVCHKYGVREMNFDWATRTTITVYENVQRLIETPTGPRDWVLTFSAVGAALMLGLVSMYYRFYWWPIHPIGYLAAYSSAMRILWFSFLVGWLANHLCLHYGGMVLFRNVRNFFIGLIIGDFLMGGLWAVVGLIMGGAGYQVLPA
jgi:hypothetical protein